jgi:integrase
MGNVRQRGKRSFELSYQVAGRRRFETIHCETRTQALRELKRREGKAVEGRLPVDAYRLTFDQMAKEIENEYKINERKSIATLRSHLVRLRDYFGGWRVAAIATSNARAYAAKRLTEGAKPATVNRELADLRRMFSLAVEGGRIDFKPHVPLLEERNARKGFFEPSQFETVVAHLPQYLKQLARFGFLVGWRRGEITSLEWSQVDFVSQVIRLWPNTTKNDEGRVLPLEGELLTIIKQQHAERRPGCPWVFHHGGRRIVTFRKSWRAACLEAKCPGMLFHDLRRTASRSLRRAGLSESESMAITGHKTPSVFRRYSIISEPDLRDAISRALAFTNGERAGEAAKCGKSVANDSGTPQLATAAERN